MSDDCPDMGTPAWRVHILRQLAREIERAADGMYAEGMEERNAERWDSYRAIRRAAADHDRAVEFIEGIADELDQAAEPSNG